MFASNVLVLRLALGTAAHTALGFNMQPVEVSMCGGGAVTGDIYSSWINFPWTACFAAACVVFMCADRTVSAASKTPEALWYFSLLSKQNLWTGPLFRYLLTPSHNNMSNHTHVGHTRLHWMCVDTKILNCQCSSICGLFYLWAEIRLLSCFHLHHFACPIELNWLHLQEGDGHHKKAADGWIEIKCNQRMCTNPPISLPLSLFEEERGIIKLGYRPLSMWKPLEQTGLRSFPNGDLRSVLDLPTNETLV